MKQKGLRKLVSMILAVVMVLSMSAVAFADDATYTITINNETKGYTYIAYQIFAGVVSEDGTTLSNVEFGSALSETDQSALLTYYSKILSADEDEDGAADYENSAAGLAEALADGKISAANFAAQVATYTLTSGVKSVYSESNTNYTITVTGAGYYLIDNTNAPTGNYAYSDYIMKVVEDTEATPKSGVPSSDKTVGDINDSSETTATTSINDSADYDIGDDVPFTLTATLPSTYYDNYTAYKLVFHDVLSEGLTFNNDVTVTVTTEGTTTTVASGYIVAPDENDSTIELEDEDCTFEVQIADANALYDEDGNKITVSAGSVITVTYTAELNENAVIGNPGNPNTMHITYSNDPNGITNGSTVKDIVVVYTYELIVNKVDDDGNALAGAGFTLYKKGVNGKYVQVGEEATAEYQAVTITEFADDVTYYTYDDTSGTYTVVADTNGAPDSETNYYIYVSTQFTFEGLDDGEYKLSESTTPDGYNTMDDVTFTIIAVHTEEGITSLTVEGLTATTSYTNGTISTTIYNYAGSILPSTGGIGTTIFYIIGGVLVAGAAVLLITKKRLGKME